MITININIDENNIINFVKISGHAGFDKKGSDIVCASVSILVYSIHLSLKKLPDLSFDFFDRTNEILLLVENYQDNILGELKGISLYFISGLKLLERDYNKYITIDLNKGE